MKSIRTKILVVVISGLLMLSFLIGGVVLFATNKILYRDADMIMGSVSEHEADKINAILDDMQKSIQIVSEAAEEQLDSADALLDIEYQQAYTRDMEILFNNAARNTEGMIAYYFRYNPELDLPDVGFFYSVSKQSSEIKKLPVTDLSGDRTTIRWWHEPTTAGKAVWIAPYYHSDSDFLMVSYVTPFYKDNKLIGVVGMDIQLSHILDAVKEISPYENGYAYLLSRTGKELYHPSEVVVAEGADTETVTARADLDNGMTLVVCAYYDDIQAQGTRMVTAMVIASICVFALFIVLTVIITQKIVSPLRRLAASAKSMGDGSTLMDWKCDLKDEVGVLYNVLNDTNQRLYEYMSNVQAQVFRDALTGLKNRAAFNKAIEQLEERKENEETLEFGFVVLDVNNMKLVNDKYGHRIGDELLRRVAKLIAGVFRRSPVYRTGGDEFIVLLENDDYKEYEKLIELLDKLYKNEIFTIDEDEFAISIARGVALYDSHHDSEIEGVVQRADAYMYSHKRETKQL